MYHARQQAGRIAAAQQAALTWGSYSQSAVAEFIRCGVLDAGSRTPAGVQQVPYDPAYLARVINGGSA